MLVAAIGLLIVYAAMSIVTFVAFAVDKLRAKMGTRRTPEKTLHTLSVLGGFPGALAAMMLVRHKSAKQALWIVNIVSAACHALLVVGLWWALA